MINPCDTTPLPPVLTPDAPASGLTARELLTRIDGVVQGGGYLRDALMTVEKIPHPDGEPETACPRAASVAEIVRAREETNRQVLRLLEKMYDDLRRQA